ncbi:MAG: hypothetical protein MO852_15480 [Candidatus Devosia euplotis]|nr:hypothetical protein [Candidatus Devosia euplotis]
MAETELQTPDQRIEALERKVKNFSALAYLNLGLLNTYISVKASGWGYWLFFLVGCFGISQCVGTLMGRPLRLWK